MGRHFAVTGTSSYSGPFSHAVGHFFDMTLQAQPWVKRYAKVPWEVVPLEGVVPNTNILWNQRFCFSRISHYRNLSSSSMAKLDRRLAP
ncbi:hypothetical protein PoB_002245700 [Plakobranchus ocellatus]|uniref:Uncharacterized protein n=1 Tax=Plakobranchus ocellatus TaxID=259542 RepID=A0AAV3ZMR1_9GAST|nr:hypothetical protein PoB_002245700 [Plakobranchus ocellatus]